MAWIEQLKSGKYRGCYRDSAGRKQHTGLYVRKKDAREDAQEREVKARRVAAAEAGALSARTPWATWWEISAPVRHASDSDRTDRSIARNYLLPRWGAVPLNKITRLQVKKWIDDLTPGREPAYVRRIFGQFAASMARAFDDEIIAANPCSRMKNLPAIPRRAKAHVTELSLGRLLEVDRAGRPRYLRVSAHRAMVAVALDTGLRPNELCGLHADRVDLAAGWITVAEVLVDRKRVIRPWPKDKDFRSVPLTAKAAEVLGAVMAGRELTGGCGLPHVGGAVCASDLVFRNDRGGCIPSKTLGTALLRAAKAAGMTGASPYAFRRGFGTRAAHGGLSMFTLKEIMGHASMDQTDEYVQQTPESRAMLRAALGEKPELRLVGQPERGAERGAERDGDSLMDAEPAEPDEAAQSPLALPRADSH